MPKLRNKPVGRLDEVDFIELRFLQMIRRKIAEQGLTMRAVARFAGIKRTVVGHTLSGSHALTFRAAYRLCKAVGIDFNPKIRKIKEAKKCRRRGRPKKKVQSLKTSENSIESK